MAAVPVALPSTLRDDGHGPMPGAVDDLHKSIATDNLLNLPWAMKSDRLPRKSASSLRLLIVDDDECQRAQHA